MSRPKDLLAGERQLVDTVTNKLTFDASSPIFVFFLLLEFFLWKKDAPVRVCMCMSVCAHSCVRECLLTGNSGDELN